MTRIDRGTDPRVNMIKSLKLIPALWGFEKAPEAEELPKIISIAGGVGANQ